MKYLVSLLILIITFTSCKSDTNSTKEIVKEASIGEKIANAHGYQNWDTVKQIDFTFNVDRDSSHYERHWTWLPKQNKVIANNTTQFYRHKLDSTTLQLDRGFINDKFWLLTPFQLVWDTTATLSEPVNAVSPVKKENLQKITITYPNTGGYTPGDAYDIYYDNNYLIREWVFRKGNSKEPSLTNTFEDYKTYNGIKIAINHKKDDTNWNLNFTDINITVEE